MSLIKLFFLISFIFSSEYAFSQITGVVVDEENNDPIIGVTLFFPSRESGTVTDENGRFEFELEPDQIPFEIKVSAIGYKVKTLFVENIDINLQIGLEPLVIQGEELFIEADRLSGIKSESSPIAVNRLTAVDFQNSIRTSAPELLRARSGVFVQQTSVGQGSVYVRGRAGRDVLYIFNGFRMNPGFVRSGQNQYFGSIDPFSVSEIEVYRGPVSLYYGSDALTGAVHVKPIVKSYSITSQNGGQILTQANLGGTGEKTVNGQIFRRSQNYSLFLNGTFRDFDKYKMPESSDDNRLFPLNNELDNADYKFLSLQGSGRFRFSSNLNLVWVSFHSRLPEAPRFDRMMLGYDIESETPPVRPRDGFFSNTAPLVFSAHSLSLRISPNNRYLSTAVIKAGFHHLKDDRLSIPFAENDAPQYSVNPSERKNSFSLSDERLTDNNRSNQWLLSTDFKSLYDDIILNWGGDFNFERISSSKRINGTESGLPRFPDGSEILSGGFFTHANFTMSDRLNLEGGLRFSLNRVFVPFEGTETARGFAPLTQTFSQFTGSVGMRYSFTKMWDFTGNISTGFRAPNIADLSELGIRRSNQFQTANSDLNPEETLNIDFGTHMNSADFSLSTNLFWLHYFEKIDRVLTGNLVNLSGNVTSEGDDGLTRNPDEFIEVQSANVGTMNLLGVELDGNIRLQEFLKSGITFTYIWGETDQAVGDRVPVDRIPPANGILFIDFQGLKDFTFRSQIRYAFSHRRISPGEITDNRVSEDGTDGFTNLQLISAWQGRRNLEMRVLADNLLNRQYREHASSLDGLARNVTVSLKYSF